MCPSTGSTCDDCIAQKCCAQAIGCLENPACDMVLQCLITCVSGGKSQVACLMMCGFNGMAIQAGLCVANNCGQGICL
jgi:hypothetical protein